MDIWQVGPFRTRHRPGSALAGIRSAWHGSVVAALLGWAAGAPMTALAAPSLADATLLFSEAATVCARDHGRLWGHSLCGPVLLVDYTDRGVLANQPDTDGTLQRQGAVYAGVLPDSVIVADTPTDWSGTHWTQIVGPLPADPARRHVLIAHELFHRIQPALGLTRPEAGNGHLDTLDGRYLLQLEWRALAGALRATRLADRRAGVADALAFRHERDRLFPSAAADEAALEIAEGMPEYTGVVLGLTRGPDRVAYAIHDLSAFVDAPTFVRSFAYASGPAYGLLLDQADPAWRQTLQAGQGLDRLLASAWHLDATALQTDVPVRIGRYDGDGTLRAAEVRRDTERKARLQAYRDRLVEHAVLVLPLAHSNYQFNPQTLVPLGDAGTVYPSMRLTDDWGALTVDHGGALVGTHRATVTAVGADTSGLHGDGWTLVLNAGWRVQPGERAGDVGVVQVVGPHGAP